MPSKSTTKLEDLIDAGLKELDVTTEEHDQAEAKRRKRWRQSMKDIATDVVTDLDEVQTGRDDDTQSGQPMEKKAHKKRRGPM